MKSYIFLALTLTSFTALDGFAATVTTFADIETWVGTGSNEAALVIDWNDGSEPLAWGYRWDGDATGADMFAAIAAADDRLYGKVNGLDDAFTILFGIGYDLDDDGFGIVGGSGSTTFNEDGLLIATTGTADGATAEDVSDLYAEGWFADGFWGQWVSSDDPYAGGSWGFGGGIATPIADGDWQGWSYAPAFDFGVGGPSQPIAVGTATTVPEPSSAWLLLLALLAARFAVRR